MNDTMLLLVGFGTFGLMVIGIIFTVVEFRALGERDRRRSAANINPSLVNKIND